ncbi:MAG TPA: DNA polymerase III subunit alpha [Desulfonatronum sp.]|nr:DNA polymerase III subunit alpha [Desulfonatronum sp.]
MRDFVHLHCHSDYSFLNSTIQIHHLCARASYLGMSAVALTDFGNLYGAMEFYRTAREFGLKPIIGCEVVVSPGHRHERIWVRKSQVGFHLVLLAKNIIGWRNLVRLVSLSHLEGWHFAPRVDKELLAAHHEGLIALSGCRKGEVPRRLNEEGFDAGLACAREYASIFQGRFYLELSANGLQEQVAVNDRLRELSKSAGLPIVATNNCHYLDREDVQAHEVLRCIQSASNISTLRRMMPNPGCMELHYKSSEEMAAAFADCPQALAATMDIARACNLELDLDTKRVPVPPLPQETSPESALRKIVLQGLQKRLKKGDAENEASAYSTRLDEELDVICGQGLAGYFLVVQDFINWARTQGVPVGPGRGATAGSLTAFVLGITDLDPLRHDLLFECFLNTQLKRHPDIETDFCLLRRDEVLRYVRVCYGQDRVAFINTFARLRGRRAIMDTAQALEMDRVKAHELAMRFPAGKSIEQALEQRPELRMLMTQKDGTERTIRVATRIEGVKTHAGTHAASLVVSHRPLIDDVPLCLGNHNDSHTQWDVKCVKQAGQSTFTFLGLKELTVIQSALEHIRKAGKSCPDLDALPWDDAATFSMLSQGRTQGVFNLNSKESQRALAALRPAHVSDLAAWLALHRPIPEVRELLNAFIRRKHGHEPARCVMPELDQQLTETCGLLIYQEQIMRIAADVTGCAMNMADMLRRELGRNNQPDLTQSLESFVQGAVRTGMHQAECARKIFDFLKEHAPLAACKAHCMSYALITYRTAYLKAHYPEEFMAAV